MRNCCDIPTNGDVCVGDTIFFEEMVFEGYSLNSRGTEIGRRRILAEVEKESYGNKKQQHTFRLKILDCVGTNPIPAEKVIFRKGRTLHRFGCNRSEWEKESDRKLVLEEKHARGRGARLQRDIRKGVTENPQHSFF